MNSPVDDDIAAWESEGGATRAPLGVRAISMSGTESQVEWAERIKLQVNDNIPGAVIPIAVQVTEQAEA